MAVNECLWNVRRNSRAGRRCFVRRETDNGHIFRTNCKNRRGPINERGPLNRGQCWIWLQTLPTRRDAL